MDLPIHDNSIQFVRRGEIVSLRNVPPTRTLLEVLPDDLHCTGTKEGCNVGELRRLHRLPADSGRRTARGSAATRAHR